MQIGESSSAFLPARSTAVQLGAVQAAFLASARKANRSLRSHEWRRIPPPTLGGQLHSCAPSFLERCFVNGKFLGVLQTPVVKLPSSFKLSNGFSIHTKCGK